MAASSTRHIEPLLPTAAPSAPSFIAARYRRDSITRRAYVARDRGQRWDTTTKQFNPPIILHKYRRDSLTRRAYVARDRGQQWSTVPPQFNPPIIVPKQRRDSISRRAYVARDRGQRWDAVPPQFNPPIILHKPRRDSITRRAYVARDRGQRFDTVPPQFNPPFPFTHLPVTRSRRNFTRRSKQWQVTPPQVNPPYLFELIRESRHISRFLPPRHHPRDWEVLPPQFNPPRTFTVRVTRQRRNFRARRGHTFETVPTQQVTPTAPAYPFTIIKALTRKWDRTKRSRTFTPVRPQVNPPYPFIVPITRTRRAFIPRRPKRFIPTPITIVAPTFPFRLIKSPLRRAVFYLRRHKFLPPIPPLPPLPPSIFKEPTYGFLDSPGTTSGELESSGLTYTDLIPGETSGQLESPGTTYSVLESPGSMEGTLDT